MLWLEVELESVAVMSECLVAPGDSPSSKAERFHHMNKVREGDVRHVSLAEAPHQLSRLHSEEVASMRSSMRRFGRFFSMRTAQTLYSGMREVGS